MFTEDLTAFFADFAVATTRNGTAITSGTISDRVYAEVLGTDVISGSEPQVLAIASEVSGVAAGDAIVVGAGPNAGTYSVVEIQPDGTGLTILRLAT